jgi:long-chain acyl-CoA synthetase
METIPGLLESAAAWRPEHALFLFAGRTFTYGEINADANKIAHALRELDIAADAPVAVLMPSRPAFASVYYGIQKAGLIAAPLNAMFRPDEIVAMVNYLGATSLVCSPALLPLVEEKRSEMPDLRYLLVLPDSQDPLVPSGADDLSARMADQSSVAPRLDFSPSSVTTIFHTSGTTGRPKGAAQTHVNTLVGSRQLATFAGFRLERERLLCALPLFNNFGSTAVLNLAVSTLSTIDLLEKWDTQEAVARVRDGANRFMGTPTMFIYLLEGHDPELHGEVRLDACLVAGQKCPAEVRAAFEARFGCNLIDAYGATETHFVAATSIHAPQPVGTVGTQVGQATIRVEREDGSEAPAGEVGELVLGGDTICVGYWRDEERTLESFGPYGWRSGDLGYQDDQGYFYVVDRKKDLVITGGANIYPAELEHVLYEHEAVSMATVIGIPDPVKGEIPVAYVVLKPGHTLDDAGIITFMRDKLAAYKVPREIRFVEALPTSAVGKVLKRELRDQVLAEMAGPEMAGVK